MENFAGFIQAGALNGQGLSNAFVQVVTNNQPIYSYFMYEFRGYDAVEHLSMLMLLELTLL
jgi:iron complex outermembrane receptor protein